MKRAENRALASLLDVVGDVRLRLDYLRSPVMCECGYMMALLPKDERS